VIYNPEFVWKDEVSFHDPERVAITGEVNNYTLLGCILEGIPDENVLLPYFFISWLYKQISGIKIIVIKFS